MATVIRGGDNFDTAAVGKVLQVVIDSDSASQTLATNTYTDTNLSITITPSSTSSKFICEWNMNSRFAANNNGFGVRLLRDSTAVYTSSQKYSTYGGASGNEARIGRDFKAIDSPNTASSITYKVQVASYNSGTIYLKEGDAAQLVVTELSS